MNTLFHFLSVPLLLVVSAVFLGACQPAGGASMPPDFTVSHERGPCFGACPVYSLTIASDGAVSFNGEMWVEAMGRQEANLPSEEVMSLHQAIESSGFFAMDDDYTMLATDLPTIITTVTMQGRTKSVSHYGLHCEDELDPAPPELCEIEDRLEAVPISFGWISPE